MVERLCYLVCQLIFISVALYLRPYSVSESAQSDQKNPYSSMDYVRFGAEALTCLMSCTFIFVQQFTELKAQGLIGFLKSLPNAPEKGVYIFSNILILCCIPLRFLDLITLEEGFLAVAIPGCWIYLLFFARCIMLTGPFVQIIYNMVAGDLLRFSIFSSIFIASFAIVFQFLGKDMSLRQEYGAPLCNIEKSDHTLTAFSNLFESIITLFRHAMGNYEYDDFDCTYSEWLIKMLSCIFMFIMPLMLINMLIAMMGNTYMGIISEAEKAWRQQWAQSLIVLERSISKERLAKYQEEYSIDMTNDQTSEEPTRGLLVIKQTKATKAAQRKHAVANWKRLVRKVLRLLMSQSTGGGAKSVEVKGQPAVPKSDVAPPPSSNNNLDFRMSRSNSLLVKSLVVSMMQQEDDRKLVSLGSTYHASGGENSASAEKNEIVSKDEKQIVSKDQDEIVPKDEKRIVSKDGDEIAPKDEDGIASKDGNVQNTVVDGEVAEERRSGVAGKNVENIESGDDGGPAAKRSAGSSDLTEFDLITSLRAWSSARRKTDDDDKNVATINMGTIASDLSSPDSVVTLPHQVIEAASSSIGSGSGYGGGAGCGSGSGSKSHPTRRFGAGPGPDYPNVPSKNANTATPTAESRAKRASVWSSRLMKR